MRDHKGILSALNPLLGSNEPPVPQQRSDIASCELPHRAAPKQTLSQLHSSKAALRNDMKKYSSILSPIRCIPPEIIRTIMLYYNIEHAPDTEFNQSHTRNLALVSRQWYQVAVSTPQLWSGYTIDWRNVSSDSSGAISSHVIAATTVSQASAHFSKAPTLPICLNLRLGHRLLHNEVVLDFTRNLAPRVGRLHVYIYAEKSEEAEVALSKILGLTTIWPLLWDLNIDLEMEKGDIDCWCGGVFKAPSNRFPSIGSVGLQGRGERYLAGSLTIEDWNMPWAQLSSIVLGSFSLDDAQDIVNALNQCANLQECFIDLKDCSDGISESVADTTDPSKPIELLKLTTFHLSTDSEFTSKCILDRLSLPALRRLMHSLNINFPFEAPNPYTDESPRKAITRVLSPLTDLIKRSSCSETLVDISLKLAAALPALQYIPERVHELFEEVPRLQRLLVTGQADFPDQLLCSLPASVNYLEIELTQRGTDYNRKNFAKFLRSHCRARQSANEGVPQKMDASFKILRLDDEDYVEWVRKDKSAVNLRVALD